ncbi:MAG: hypothetical protein FJ276_22580 [Planctomycetes bacterium]|nr:hypothetical protein [Planctomycetota bacterium]
MTETAPSDKIPLTVHLPAELAVRLKKAAESRNRAPADLVAELLDKYLPSAASGPQQKGRIPYT